uniref:Uncharacterized protein n=1 Tax=Trichobilharzia regenti TaxID=157069 RepID=A0AA85IS32_TRIRE|nr:unnamed protein product [Trichobilharzia regenti]
MHASLAAIGRACTVEEDEDPPATPIQTSLDSQQADYIEQSLRLCTSTTDELITFTLSLCQSVKILTNFNQAVVLDDFNESEKIKLIFKTDEVTDSENQQLPTSVEGITTSVSTVKDINELSIKTLNSTHNIDNLNNLSVLHRFCLTIYKIVHLDTLNTTLKELSLGLIALLAHSENIIIKELNLLDCILTKFSISTNNSYSFQVLYEKKSTRLLNDYNEFLLTTLLHFDDENNAEDDNDTGNDDYMASRTSSANTRHYDHSSQLSELRILCESLRQCWTQMKRLANEHRYMCCRLNQLNTSNNCDRIFKRIFLNACKMNSFHSKVLTLAIINSAQHLIYSGVSLLGHIELTRFTHDELWEMTRGIEELSILRGHLHNTFQSYRNTRLHRLLCNYDSLQNSYQATLYLNDYMNSSRTLLSQIISYDLLSDPADVTFSISVGCLFSLFAKQRSLRLAHLIYLQLYRFSKLFLDPSGKDHADVNNYSERNLISQEYHKYINDNHGLLASDYLRNEYEFISSFLDILSQSTDLLYQVQKLQHVCTSAAATAQVRQAEAEQRLKTGYAENKPKQNSMSSHALSVEGKHGILVRNSSMSHSNTVESKDAYSKAFQKTDIHRKGDLITGVYLSRYQDTLHRSSTLDRYVATGSPVSPYPSVSSQAFYNEYNKVNPDSNSDVDQEHCLHESDYPSDVTEDSDISNNKRNELKKPKITSKKVVQWSDHREVSTRHQIIGRYLEMTWKQTEHTLTSLFLSTSSTLLNEPIHSKTDNGNKNIHDRILCRSALIMSTEELLKLGNNIRQLTVTADFFPSGLLPVLRKQALKFEEFAVWRNWYEECQGCEDLNHKHKINKSDDFQNSTNTCKLEDIDLQITCNHLNHTSLLSVYSNCDKQLTSCNAIDVFNKCCNPFIFHNMWNSKFFLLKTDVNSIVQLMIHITKLFVNNEESWSEMLTTIQNVILSSGISSIVHKFDITIPDSYSSLLLKIYKVYELSRRLDLTFVRFLTLLRNMIYSEYTMHRSSWISAPSYRQHSQEFVVLRENIEQLTNQISSLYKEAMHTEMFFDHIENIIKCFKNLVEIVFNKIIGCILFWFGYIGENANEELMRGFKELFNPVNSSFLSSPPTTTKSTIKVSSNIDNLAEIKTGLLNADRNFLIRLGRLIGSLSQMNSLLIALDQDVNIWRNDLRETFSQTMDQLLHAYTIKHQSEILLSIENDTDEGDCLVSLLVIFLDPFSRSPENCLNLLTKTTFSIDEMNLLCQYHLYMFNYITKPTVVSLFSSLTTLGQNAISCDLFMQKYLIKHFQNRVPFNLLYEIYQSIKEFHTCSIEYTSVESCSTSVKVNVHITNDPTQQKEETQSSTEKSTSIPSRQLDLKQIKDKLNSGSTGVEIIQSTFVLMSSAMKSTMHKHMPKEPKEKIASFAADVYSNLRLPFRNQSGNNSNNNNNNNTSSRMSNDKQESFVTDSKEKNDFS